MRRMRWVFSALAATFCGLFLAVAQTPDQEPEIQVIQLKTITVHSLDVTFFLSPEDNVVAGRILANKLSREPGIIDYSLVNGKGGEVWRESLPFQPMFWENEPGGGAIIPFSFDFRGHGFAGDYTLNVVLWDKDKKRLGVGSRQIELAGDTAPGHIADLVFSPQGARADLSFTFVNGSAAANLAPVINVYEHNEHGDLIMTYQDEARGFQPLETQTVTLNMPLPTQPELYQLQVAMEDEEGKSVTGLVRRSFFIDGEFVRVEHVRLKPDQNWEKGQEVEFVFTGLVRASKAKPLSFQTAIRQRHQGQSVGTIQHAGPLNVKEDRTFEYRFSHTLEAPATQFLFRTEILRDGTVLSTANQEVSSFVVFAPAEDITHAAAQDEPLQPPAVTPASDAQGGNGVFVILLLVVVTLLVAVIIAVVKVSRRTLNLLILTPLLFVATASAAYVNEWYHPVDGWGYDPDSTTSFQTVRFEGLVVDQGNDSGFFATGTLNDVLVRFDDGSSQVDVSVPTGNVSITINGTKYSFDLDVPVSLADGSWTPQIAFTVGGTQAWTSWTGAIIIDNTPPTLSFSYDPSSYTNGAVNVDVTCSDAGGVGCVTSNFSAYEIEGNFCANADNCDTTATRGFEVCDIVDNCTTFDLAPTATDPNKLSVDWFDPIPPIFNAGVLWRDFGLATAFGLDGTGSVQGTGEGESSAYALEANEVFTLAVDVIDPSSHDNPGYDDHACGSALSPFFEKNGTACAQDILHCVLNPSRRGTRDQSVGAACVGSCGTGFEDDGAGNCVERCSQHKFPMCLPHYVQ